MLNELLHPAVGIWMLSEQMQFRLYDYPQDGPLPTKDIRASGSAFTPRVVHLMERAGREGLSVRECGILVAASRSHGSFVGTPVLVQAALIWLRTRRTLTSPSRAPNTGRRCGVTGLSVSAASRRM